jgi:hypothetical protein
MKDAGDVQRAGSPPQATTTTAIFRTWQFYNQNEFVVSQGAHVAALGSKLVTTSSQQQSRPWPSIQSHIRGKEIINK